MEDWKNLGETVLDVASFIPGPIGLIATGIQAGLAIWDWIDDEPEPAYIDAPTNNPYYDGGYYGSNDYRN